MACNVQILNSHPARVGGILHWSRCIPSKFVTVQDKVPNAIQCVVLFRQEIEMKQCSAYGEMRQHHALPAPPQIVDTLADYEPVGENDSIYEQIPGES